MRVTENSNFETVRNSVGRSRGRMEALQQKYATLKKLNTPSDDPVGAAKVLEVRTEKVNNQQFQSNARLAETYLNMSELALEEIGDLLVRAKEIALSQSSPASSNEDTRLGISEEVNQLFQQAVAAGNRRIGDRYLFGGYKTTTPPISPDGKYQGDLGQIMYEIGRDVFIGANITGLEAFNTEVFKAESVDAPSTRTLAAEANENVEPARQNYNLFDELQKFRVYLLTGDTDGIRSTLESFDKLHGQVTAMRTKVGSRIEGIKNMSRTLERNDITNAQLSSALEDADMAQVVSDLAQEETVFRSALASSQKLVQPSLMDFLK